MTSSNDDSTEPGQNNVVDIRNRLPPVAFGESLSGQIAAKILKIIETENAEPYEHIAALMMVSHTIQNVLRHGRGTSEKELTYIMERAIEITDNTRIILHFKEEKK